MTVCIGALCENKSCAVLVADRMVTSGLDIQFEHPVSNKITALAGNCLALTSGNALAHTELFNTVRGQTVNTKFTSVEEFVEVIKTSYQNLRHKQIVERTLMPRGFNSLSDFYQAASTGLNEGIVVTIMSEIDGAKYGIEILVGGISPGESHLYLVNDPGTSHCLDSLGFCVIGSGMNLAMSTLIANKCHQELELHEAMLRALEAKMTSENAPGVGRRTDISVILPADPTPADPIGAETIRFNDDEIKQLRDLCESRRDGDDTYVDKTRELIASKRGNTSGQAGQSLSKIADKDESNADQPATKENAKANGSNRANDAVPDQVNQGEG